MFNKQGAQTSPKAWILSLMRRRVMVKKILVGLLTVIFLVGGITAPLLAASIMDDYIIVEEVRYLPGDEVVEQRTENSKTFYQGNGKYALEISMGAIHYKNNYSSSSELWKDIDTTIVDGVVTKAPFILTVDTAQKSIYILNRKDLAECTLRLDDLLFDKSSTFMSLSKPVVEGNTVTWADIATDTDLVLVVNNTQVKFQRILKSDKAPNVATFTVTEVGKSYLTYRAFDNNREPVDFDVSKDDYILIEKIDLTKISVLQYPVRIDPTFSVGASSDDSQVYWNGSSWVMYALTAEQIEVGYASANNFKNGAGLRFQNITVSQGMTIDAAYLTLTSIGNKSAATVNARITGEDVDDAAAWSNIADYQARRGTVVGGANDNFITDAQVDWNAIATWSTGESGPDTTSPDIKAIIQEIVDRVGWASGQDMALWWDDHDDRSTHASGTTREGASWDNVTYDPPLLTIEYTVAPTIITNAADGLGDTTATLNGTVIDDGGATIDYYGFVWDTGADQGDPGDADPGGPPGTWDFGWKSGIGDYGENPFDHGITGLPTGTTIYFRAGAHNSTGWAYGGGASFLTKPAAPTNVVASDGTYTNKVLVTWTASVGATDYHVWRDAVDLGAAGDVETFDDGGASPDETVYTYKVVASNATGNSDDSATDTGWRNGDPTVTTNAASPVEETTATLDGDITNIGGANATTRGFEWDTDSGAPYANDWHEDGDFGVANFTHALDSLTKGELYYYRAYATNTYGTAYGAEQTFLTKPDPPNTLVATSDTTEIDLTWVKPASADKTYIRGKDGSYPADRADGYLVYNDTLELTSDAGLTGGHTYYYKAWSWSTEGGKTQFSDNYDFAFATPGLTLVLHFQPVTMVIATDHDGVADAGSDADTIIDDTLTQIDDYWIGALVTIISAGDAAPEGETSICTAFAAATDEVTVNPAFSAAVDADDTFIIDFGTLIDEEVNSGTADAGALTTLTDAVLAEANDYWNNMTLEILTTTDGLAPQGESTTVTAFAATVLTFDTLTVAVEAGDTYELRSDGTITWGVNPTGVSYTVGGLESSGAVASVSTEEPEIPSILPSTPGIDLFTESSGSNIPLFGPMFEFTATLTGWPIALFWYVGSISLAAVFGALALMYLHSMLISAFAVGIVLSLACTIDGGVISWNVLYIYLIMAVVFIVYQRVLSV